MAGAFSYCFGFISGSMSSNKISQKGNPYVDEMVFKNDEQKAIYQNQWFPTQSNQTIFFVEDGFAYYLVVNEYEQQQMKQQKQSQENAQPKYSTNVLFKELINRITNEPSNSILFKAHTHPPTLTATGVRALVQGNLPAYLSIMSNMGSTLLSQDNIVYQAKNNNPFRGFDEKRTKILFFGGVTWQNYFGKAFDRSEFIEETNFHTREQQDMQLYKKVQTEQMNNTDWSCLFMHFNGIDKASHVAETIYDVEFKKTVSAKSDILGKILNNTQQSTVNTDQTLILISDHGLDFHEIGHHGGYNVNETNSVLFGYSKKGFIQKEQKDIGQMMDRENLATQIFSIHSTSTFCMLQGLPIPSNNLGMIIPDFFINKPEVDDFVIANNYYTNFRQIQDRFADACTEATGGIDAAVEIKQFASQIKKQYTNVIQALQTNQNQAENLKKFVEQCFQYSVQVINTIEKEVKDPQLVFMNEGLAIHLIVSALIVFSVFVLKKVSHAGPETIEQITNGFEIFIKKLSLVIVVFIAFYGAFYLILKVKIFFSFQVALISCVTLYTIFLSTRFLFSKNEYQIVKEQQLQGGDNSILNKCVYLTNIIFIISSVGYFTYSRTTNDIFMNSYDYYLNYLEYYCYFLGLLTILKFKENKIKKTLLIILKIATIPVLLYYIGIYCPRFNELTIRINNQKRDEVMKSESLSQTIPLGLFYILFTYLIANICRSIRQKCSNKYILFFLYQNFIMVNSVAAFYYCLWNNVYFEQAIQIFPTISMVHMIIGEIVKYVYIKNKEIHFSTNWKVFTTSINFTLGVMYTLEANSLVQLPLFFLIVYLVCTISLNLKIVSESSMFIFLFYLSQHLFFASGHTELFSELHVKVLSYMNIIKGNIVPVFNGTLNTYFYLIITALLLPIFNSLVQLDLKNKNSTIQHQNILNYVLDINLESFTDKQAEVQQTDDDEDVTGTKQQDNDSLNLIQHHGQQKSQEHLEQCSYSLYSLIFITPIIVGFNGADIRNILKPNDSWKESYYMPNYLFQLIFLTLYFLIMVFNIFVWRKNQK